MNIEWNRVTWYSKTLAVLLGLLIFWLGFHLGRQPQATNSDAPSMVSGENEAVPKTPVTTSNTSTKTSSNSSKTTVSAAPAGNTYGNVTEAIIKNATYTVWMGSETAVLKDGKMDDSKKNVHSQIGAYAIKDLDGDGKSEALVAINTSRADSMTELFLVTNQNGKIATTLLVVPLTGNPEVRTINSIKIDSSNVIMIGLTALRPNDPRFSPSINGTFSFRYSKGALILIN